MLGSTLFATAGVAILALGPLIWDQVPEGVARARPLILALAAIAGVLLGLEWLGVH